MRMYVSFLQSRASNQVKMLALTFHNIDGSSLRGIDLIVIFMTHMKSVKMYISVEDGVCDTDYMLEFVITSI